MPDKSVYDNGVKPGLCKRRALVALLVGLMPFLTNCGAPQNIAAIQHTVIIFNENHTFDNYFGGFPGADGVASGLISTGQTVPLSIMPDIYIQLPISATAGNAPSKQWTAARWSDST